MNNLLDFILKRRTIRRFQQKAIPCKILKELIDAARFAPSAANLQPCEYVVVDEKPMVDRVFETLSWAGYIAPRGNPPHGETPIAYIVVLINEKRGKPGIHDAAAAIENMILLAWAHGIGSCWIGSVEREKLVEILKVPSHCRIDSVLALGYPLEIPVVEELTDSIKYWKDKDGTLHVPKRKLEDILYWQKYENKK
ncbi:MAG: nitroreductase family protein [Candidatus Omnitrophica bacterium]|nr:nitroreductase family protein [Candidatus Omnitrophota bacterium]